MNWTAILVALAQGNVVSRSKLIGVGMVLLGGAVLTGQMTPTEADVVRDLVLADPNLPIVLQPPAGAENQALEQVVGAGIALAGGAVYTLRAAMGKILAKFG